MLVRFLRTLGSSQPAPIGLAVAGGALLVAWTGWLFLARVSVYEVSRHARLEVRAASHPLDTPVAGRVIRSELELGRKVEAGDVLLVLDAESFALQLASEQARLASLAPQLAALERQTTEARQALLGEGKVAEASRGEALARQRASESQARMASTEREQVERLRERNFVAELETARSRSTAERQTAEADAAKAAVGRLGSEEVVRRSDRRAQQARLELELASLAGQRAQSEARVRELEREISLRTIRAPVAGRLGDVVTLRPGAYVEAATRVGVVIPLGDDLRAVAQFDPAAVGRVRPGQAARLRFFAFPWTKFGTLPATVVQVGSEPSPGQNQGLVRVELAVSRVPGSRIPFEHGLAGTAEVEVERMAPASLLLDAAGRALTRGGGAAQVDTPSSP